MIANYCGICECRIEKKMGARVCEKPECRAMAGVIAGSQLKLGEFLTKRWNDPHSELLPTRYHVTADGRKHRFYDKAKAIEFYAVSLALGMTSSMDFDIEARSMIHDVIFIEELF